MTRHLFTIAAASLALAAANTAWAASDYLLEIDGIDGAAPATIEIQSWSWGTSHPVTTGSGAQGLLRESPSLPPRGKPARVAVGDVNGDGRADLAVAAAQPEIQGFTLQFAKSSPTLATRCAMGQHFPQATIRARGESYQLVDAIVASCTDSSQPAGARNQMPNRISMNVTTPRQTQGATFGERCAASGCPVQPEMTFTITGQLKHNKTGHVTLMK